MPDFLVTTATTQQLVFLTAVGLVAGLARGFSGFGAALIFVPLASAALGPKIAVPLLLVVDGLVTLGLIPGAWRLADRHSVLTMTLGAMLGLPAGIYLLTHLDPLALRWGIAILVALMLAFLMSGWRYHGRPWPPLTVLVGALAGVLSGVAQVAGPAVVAYWLGGSLPPALVRANIILYFAISTLLAAVGYVWSGLITREVLGLTLFLAPLYGVGLWLGSRMFGLANETVFRRACYVLIGAAAILSLPLLDDIVR